MSKVSKAKPFNQPRPPKLPELLERKLYKTGQTRGADDDVIYQNRVSRNSTVLIPYSIWGKCSSPPDAENFFEKGFIVLLSPKQYFQVKNIDQQLKSQGLSLGENTLIFYETRNDWNQYNPDEKQWRVATSRQKPLGGQYVARVPGITSANQGEKIIRGFNSRSSKGAGIRLYEYASSTTIRNCRLQLEAIYWLCFDSEGVTQKNGMDPDDIQKRKKVIIAECAKQELLNIDQLRQARIIDQNDRTICPLCLKRLSAEGFFSRLKQAEGREVLDLTVTEINLFHIEELKYGVYNHRPYNLGWGHHHCNVVVKDSGIIKTLEWMYEVVQVNIQDGHLTPENNSS